MQNYKILLAIINDDEKLYSYDIYLSIFDSFQVLLHVSTAYCNCNVKYIDEKVYEPPLAPHKLLDACEYVFI